MMVKKLGRGLAVALAVCVLAALGTACGSSGGEASATESSESATEAEAPAAETETEPAAESEASGEGGSKILAGFSTPPGSTLQGTKKGAKVVHQDYKTSTAPQEVVSFYKGQLPSRIALGLSQRSEGAPEGSAIARRCAVGRPPLASSQERIVFV